MKFVEAGPDIPDELLIARDEGRVLFFCGAGVSFARAKLWDFLRLAGQVIEDLGSLRGSQARRLYDAANRPVKGGGKSYVPVDRIFTALDQEFEPQEVRNAVARALRPKTALVDLAAHRLLLDLSKGSDGRPRLVTTNFDLLFEACDARLRSWGPPHLPLPERPADFEGIIHLHGRTNPSYTGTSGDDVVLSSSDFGKAYLSDGWATQYIRRLMGRFKIVFVGYSADDPPVQYLLEALRDEQESVSNIYAFQHGAEAEAREQWAQKGVVPIAFGQDYETLWQTLSAWAERARDSEGWFDLALRDAVAGPSQASPLLRSRIAHVLGSSTGIGRVPKMATPLPSTWLYVLDPAVRFLQPMRADGSDPVSPQFDPFEHFGLDADLTPEPADTEDHFSNRGTPDDAWSGLVTAPPDIVVLTPSHAGGLVAPSHLGRRPWALASWFLGRQTELPALWWATGHSSMHPDVVQGLKRGVKYRLTGSKETARHWRYLLESWERGANADDGGYDLQSQVRRDGWSPALVRRAVDLHRAHITIKRRFATRPPMEADTDTAKFIGLDVEYAETHVEFQFDAKSLPLAVALWRDLLVEAEQLETEIGAHILLEPTRPEDGQELDVALRGMTGAVVRFTRLVQAWELADAEASAAETRTWASVAGLVFERLRIWAAGRSALTTADEASDTFADLSDATFWSYRHERDLLLSIRDRWSGLSKDNRASIESRLLTAPVPYLANHDDREEMTAVHRLGAIQYLSNRGVNFSFDLAGEKAKLMALAPSWKEDHADDVGLPSVRGPFSITTDTDPTSIIHVPLRNLLPLQPQRWDLGHRVEHDPFTGLCEKKPVRALRALHNAMRRKVQTGPYWSTFLRTTQEAPTSHRFDSAVVALISKMAPEELPGFWYPLIEWFTKRAAVLDERGDSEFDAMLDALLAAAELQQSGYKPRADRDWSFEALNSVAGRLTLALFQVGVPPDEHGVPANRLARLEKVLSLPGDHRRHALYVIARRAGWLFQEEATWTEKHVLGAAEINHPDADAFWAGFAGLGQIPSPALLKKVRDPMIDRVVREERDARHLVAHLLGGWRIRENEQVVSSAELRDVLVLGNDEVRRSVLGHLSAWAAESQEWKDLILQFLTQVWPKQRTIKTPQMSAALFKFASELPDLFASVIEAVTSRFVPLLPGLSIRMDGDDVLDLDQAGAEALVLTLELLLPEDRSEWPHDAKDLVAAIDATGKVHGPRLDALKRRAAEGDL